MDTSADQRILKERSFAIFAATFAVVMFWRTAEAGAFLPFYYPWPRAHYLIPLPLAVLVLWRPALSGLVAFFFAAVAGIHLFMMPNINNDETLQTAVALIVAGAFFKLAIQKRTWKVEAADHFDVIAPLIRLSMIAVYFWTLWHKLNADFFNPAYSCAPYLNKDLLAYVGLSFEPSVAVKTFTIWLTLIVEAIIPLGLIVPKTRAVTALFAMAFHWVLGLAGFAGFAATAWAILPLFLFPIPAQLFSGKGKGPLWNRSILAVVLLILIVPGVMDWAKSFDVQRGLWVTVPFLALGQWALFRGRPTLRHAPVGAFNAFKSPSLLLVVPILVFINGASPYWGFKTETAYAMYSNLRTENGKTNHLLLPGVLDWAPYQTDLVTVKFSNVPEIQFQSRQAYIPRVAVQLLVHRYAREFPGKDIWLNVVEKDGTKVQTQKAQDDPAWNPDFSLWERKILRFRFIPRANGNFCSH